MNHRDSEIATNRFRDYTNFSRNLPASYNAKKSVHCYRHEEQTGLLQNQRMCTPNEWTHHSNLFLNIVSILDGYIHSVTGYLVFQLHVS